MRSATTALKTQHGSAPAQTTAEQVIVLTLTGEHGSDSDSDTVTITIPGIVPPILEWDPSEPPDIAVEVGGTFTLDLDDYISNTTGSALAVTLVGVNSSFQTVAELSGNRLRSTGVAVGEDSWRIDVSAGGMSISAQMITVVSAEAEPINVTIHTNDQTVNGGTNVNLSVTITGPSHVINWNVATYHFADANYSPNTSAEDPTWEAPPGTYRMTAPTS